MSRSTGALHEQIGEDFILPIPEFSEACIEFRLLQSQRCQGQREHLGCRTGRDPLEELLLETWALSVHSPARCRSSLCSCSHHSQRSCLSVNRHQTFLHHHLLPAGSGQSACWLLQYLNHLNSELRAYSFLPVCSYWLYCTLICLYKPNQSYSGTGWATHILSLSNTDVNVKKAYMN